MARRRFQNPKLQLRGNWWTIRVWQDVVGNGMVRRSYKRIRLAPATMKQREAQKVAAEYMQPLNQGLSGVLSATNFQRYIEQTYTPLEMPLLAKSTQDRYQGVIDHYLIPSFGPLCLRDLTPMTIAAVPFQLGNVEAGARFAGEDSHGARCHPWNSNAKIPSAGDKSNGRSKPSAGAHRQAPFKAISHSGAIR